VRGPAGNTRSQNVGVPGENGKTRAEKKVQNMGQEKGSGSGGRLRSINGEKKM